MTAASHDSFDSFDIGTAMVDGCGPYRRGKDSIEPADDLAIAIQEEGLAALLAASEYRAQHQQRQQVHADRLRYLKELQHQYRSLAGHSDNLHSADIAVSSPSGVSPIRDDFLNQYIQRLEQAIADLRRELCEGQMVGS